MAISAREALSSQGMEGNRLSKFDELLGRIRGVARPVILSIRNIFRKKWRLALTLFTLVLGGAVFVGIFHLHNSMSYTLNTLNHEFTRDDVLINFSQPYRFEQMENMVRQIDGVTYVEGWSDSSVYRIRPNGLESEEMQLIAAPAGSELIQPTVVKGRWLEQRTRTPSSS
jgi:putative ABC transport system permease protein